MTLKYQTFNVRKNDFCPSLLGEDWYTVRHNLIKLQHIPDGEYGVKFISNGRTVNTIHIIIITFHVCHKLETYTDENMYPCNQIHYYEFDLSWENYMKVFDQLPNTNTLEDVLALGQFYSV